jgi:subtilase family serine protease
VKPPGARRLLTLAVLAGIAALLGATGARPASHHGTMTPATGVRAEFKRVRAVHAIPNASPTFNCQLTHPARCYTPDPIRAAYRVQPLLDAGINGSSRTIVLVDAFQSPTIQHDLAAFDSLFGLPDPVLNIVAPDGLTPFDQNEPTQVAWAAEITLDVEWSHVIAPQATILLVLAKSSADADLASATKYAIDHNLGDVVAQSFGEAEECMDPAVVASQHSLFERATAQGMTLVASSGDFGAALPNCDGSDLLDHPAIETPASDPNVTSVGGTRLFADGVTGAYDSETAWNESLTFGAAGGGGFSILYKRPPFQAPVQKAHARGVPDVSYNAGVEGGVLGVWSSSGLGPDLVFRFSGTSSGSAQWAGLVALVDQLNGGRVGDINKPLYKLGKSRSASTSIHDITIGNNSYPPITGFQAVPGWDAATGLGTPIASSLVPNLAH